MLRNSVGGVLLLFVVAAGSWGQAPITPTIYVVGSCKPTFTSFSTISAALAATPAASVVQVCPGNYAEQIVVTQPVTLQGISIAGMGQATVQPPNGFSATTVNGSLQPVAPMLWVNNVSGPVSVNDITLDGSSVGSVSAIIAGIFFQNSSGTISRVTVRNIQFVQPFADMGIYIEGGTSSPAVSVQNSSVHEIRSVGVFVEAPSGDTITATLNGNYLSGAPKNSEIFIDSGSTATVANNSVIGGNSGISTNVGTAVSISGNTVAATNFGIAVSDGATVTGNKVLGSIDAGILLIGLTPTVQNNSIIGGPVGIDYGCGTAANVKSNILNDVTTGLDNVPNGAAGANSYFNVQTIRSAGVC